MKRRTRTPEEVLEWYRNLTPQEQGRVMIDLELSTRRSRKAPVEDLEAMSLAAIELAQNPDVQARLQQALRGSVSHEAPTAPTYNNPGDLDLDDDLPYLTSDQAEEKMEQTGRAVHYIDAHTHNPSCVYPAFERDDDTMEHPGMGELGGHPNDDPDEDEDD